MLERALNFYTGTGVIVKISVVKPILIKWRWEESSGAILHGPTSPNQASKESSTEVLKVDGRQKKITPFLFSMTPVRGQSDSPSKSGVGTLFCGDRVVRVCTVRVCRLMLASSQLLAGLVVTLPPFDVVIRGKLHCWETDGESKLLNKHRYPLFVVFVAHTVLSIFGFFWWQIPC